MFKFDTFNDTVIENSLPWLSLPTTPTLPEPKAGQYAHIRGFEMWYNVYGDSKSGHSPILLIHGGMGNSNYWGDLIRLLMKDNKIITADSRGHGRSTWGSTEISYDMMTDDYLALLDHLKIDRVVIVGWSDGGIIGLNLASKYPKRIKRLFSFAAHYHYKCIADITVSEVFMAYISRTAFEYRELSPHPEQHGSFVESIQAMWGSQPTWDKSHFDTIPQVSTWIVGADRDEGILRENHDTMTNWMPKSGYALLPQVSHFAFLQDLEGFNAILQRHLRAKFHEFE